MVAGWASGYQIRVSMPGGQDLYLYLYLLACFALGGFVFRTETSRALFGMAESTVNILLLVLSVMLPLMAASGSPDLAGSFRFGAPEIINFLVVGGFLLYCFYSNPLMTRRKFDG